MTITAPPASGIVACPRCGWHNALTVPQAAAYLGVSDQTVRNAIKDGRLPGAEVEPLPGGQRMWVPLTSVEAFKASREGP